MKENKANLRKLLGRFLALAILLGASFAVSLNTNAKAAPVNGCLIYPLLRQHCLQVRAAVYANCTGSRQTCEEEAQAAYEECCEI